MKIGDKLVKAGDSLTINRYDNGFMVEVTGRDANENWETARIVVSDIVAANDLVKEWTVLPRES